MLTVMWCSTWSVPIPKTCIALPASPFPPVTERMAGASRKFCVHSSCHVPLVAFQTWWSVPSSPQANVSRLLVGPTHISTDRAEAGELAGLIQKPCHFLVVSRSR
jgi:hypothetical protein